MRSRLGTKGTNPGPVPRNPHSRNQMQSVRFHERTNIIVYWKGTMDICTVVGNGNP